jgi:uncharacterized protein YlxP (DUF503 family)
MGTTVALLHLEFRLPGACNLKDKRRWVKGFKDRLGHRWNVSAAEVGALDDRHRAVVAVAMVANDRRYLQGAIQKIVNTADTHRDMILANHEIEWL